MDKLSVVILENLFVILICIYIIQNVDTCNYVKFAISIISLSIIYMSINQIDNKLINKNENNEK